MRTEDRNDSSKVLKSTLASETLHEQWWDTYLDAANIRFHEKVFDRIYTAFSDSENDEILDAGCGNCTHAVALARRGLRVLGIDFSNAALSAGRELITQCGLSDQVTLQHDDLTALSFPDARFKNVICWGVMMHIPRFEKAIAELVRVTEPNGVIAVHENNRKSPEAVARKLVRKYISRNQTLYETEAGDEYWKTTPAGSLLARVADIPWMVDRFQAHGCHLEQRIPVQFTESYTKLSSKTAREIVHAWNDCWFNYIGLPSLASGNLLFFRKSTC